MAAIELANAYVTIVPTLKGAQKQIEQQLSGVNTATVGQKLGQQLSSGMGRALDLKSVGARLQSIGGSIEQVGSKLTRSITKPALGATTAVGGLVTVLGFKRLVGIDTARGQFQGLGYDADKVMQQVDAGVTNTSLSMAQGASMAVGILATGAVPLEGLEEQIKRVANVSAAYNVDSEHAAYLLNNILTKQKVTWGDLAQMQQNQIPIVSMLADHYGVTGDEIMRMAQEGAISIEELNAVLDQNAGAAAEAYAGTWKGVTANIMANLGKLGAKIQEGAFALLKEQATEFLAVLQSPEAAAWAERIGQQLTGMVTRIVDGIRTAITWWNSLSDTQQKAVGVLAGVAVAAGPVITVLGRIVSGVGGLVSMSGSFLAFLKGGSAGAKLLGGALRFLTGPWGLLIGGIAAAVAASPALQSALGELASTIGGILMEVLQALAPIFQELASLVLPLFAEAARLVGDLLAQIVPIIGELLAAVAPLISTLLEALLPVFQEIVAAVRPIIEALMPALAAVFEFVGSVVETVFSALGPIIEGALTIVQGIIQVVTSAIRGDWSGVWEGIKQIFTGIWETIKAIVTGAIDIVKGVIEAGITLVRNIWTSVWNAISSFFTDVWNRIVSAGQSFANSVRSTFTQVTDFIGSIPGRILGFFSGIGSWLLDSGKSLIQGFINGITQAFEWAKNKVSEGLGALRSLFPFSPAKTGPFAGRGWVLYSGLSLGSTFTEAVADSLHDGRGDIEDELEGIEDAFQQLDPGTLASEQEFRVAHATPDLPADEQARGRLVVQGPLIEVGEVTVDTEERVRELAQELWARASRADRAQGRVLLGGVVR